MLPTGGRREAFEEDTMTDASGRTTTPHTRLSRFKPRDGCHQALFEAPLFRDLARGDRSAITRLGCGLRFEAGATLARPAVRTREVLVLLEGRAVASEDGRVVAAYGPGDLIGEAAAVTGSRTTATVTAETPVRLVVFDLREFGSLLYASPEFERRVLRRIVRA
jgi:signal-transduction protein with cAMP-binding, CBS, and nucleotidyltransferase domain